MCAIHFLDYLHNLINVLHNQFNYDIFIIKTKKKARLNMSITSKIKGLLQVKNIEHAKLAENLNLSRQSLSNKFFRGSFSAADLIKIATFCKCELAFIDKNFKIILDTNDINESSEKGQ